MSIANRKKKRLTEVFFIVFCLWYANNNSIETLNKLLDGIFQTQRNQAKLINSTLYNYFKYCRVKDFF